MKRLIFALAALVFDYRSEDRREGREEGSQNAPRTDADRAREDWGIWISGLSDAWALKSGFWIKLKTMVRAKTTDGTNLYGSVRVEDIVSAIAAQGVDIDRTQIGLEAPITAVGPFDVPVKLHPEVELKIKVWVVEA